MWNHNVSYQYSSNCYIVCVHRTIDNLSLYGQFITGQPWHCLQIGIPMSKFSTTAVTILSEFIELLTTCHYTVSLQQVSHGMVYKWTITGKCDCWYFSCNSDSTIHSKKAVKKLFHNCMSIVQVNINDHKPTIPTVFPL